MVILTIEFYYGEMFMDFSSFGVSMVEDYTFILKQQQLEKLYELTKLNDTIPKFHIYMIIKRPRIFFDKDSLKLNKDFFRGKFKIQDKDSFKTLDFEYEHNFKEREIEIQCEYPYDQLYFIDKIINKRISGGYGSLMLQQYDSGKIDYIDNSEVVYIGQSLGKGGSRTAETRLLNHSTLQRIYSENTPDKEIWITLWSFTRNELMFLSPNVDENINHELTMRYLNYLQTRYAKISFEQEINFIEAALIRYFKPMYNDDFKYSFPSKSHSTYSQCYTLGLDFVSVEIDTTRLNMRIWSQENPDKKFKHDIIFPLKNKFQINNFFGIK